MDALSRGFRLIGISKAIIENNIINQRKDFMAVPEPDDDTALRMTSLQVMNILAHHQELSSQIFTILGWSSNSSSASSVSSSSTILVPQVPVTAYTLLPRSSSVFDNDDPYNFSLSTNKPYDTMLQNRRIDDVQVKVNTTQDTDSPTIDYPTPFLHSSTLPVLPTMNISLTSSNFSNVVSSMSTSGTNNIYEIILYRIVDLASRITQKEARTALLKLKNEKPDAFASSALYAHVHALLSRYTLSLPVRRFIHNLFDRVSFSDRAWTW